MKKLLYKSIVQPLARLYWLILKPKTYGARSIVLFGNEILLVKNANVEKWSLPGGKIERMETPVECALREIQEELSIHINEVKYKLGTYLSKKEGKRDTVHIFVAESPSRDFVRQWEIDDAKWFSLDALPGNMSSATIRRMEEYKQGKRDILADW